MASKEAASKIQSGAFHETQVTTEYGHVVVGIAARLKMAQEEVAQIAAIEGWDASGQDNEDFNYFIQYVTNMHSMLCGAAIVDTRRQEIGKKGL